MPTREEFRQAPDYIRGGYAADDTSTYAGSIPGPSTYFPLAANTLANPPPASLKTFVNNFTANSFPGFPPERSRRSCAAGDNGERTFAQTDAVVTFEPPKDLNITRLCRVSAERDAFGGVSDQDRHVQFREEGCDCRKRC